MELRPQAIIAGRYRAERKVGAGAMGEVWQGQHAGVGTRVALKRLLPACALSHEMIARFKREAYLLARVRSDYVARVLDFVDDKTYGLVLVLEFVEGDVLYDVLQLRRYSVEEAVMLGVDILSGLADLHQAQVVHRDLKPGNIILQPRPRGGTRAVLVDFGMSRVMAGPGDGDEEMTGITRADVALGTLEYMAPEQILNSRAVSGSADVYAAGAILFRAISGCHAYGGESDGALARAKLSCDAPPMVTGRVDPLAQRLEALVARAMRRKPSERFANAEAMLVELEEMRDMVRQSVAAASLRGLNGQAPTSASYPRDAAAVTAAVARVSSSTPIDTGRPSQPSTSPTVAAVNLAARSTRSPKTQGTPLATRPLVLAVGAFALAATGFAGAWIVETVRAPQVDANDVVAAAADGPATTSPLDTPAPERAAYPSPPAPAAAPTVKPVVLAASASALTQKPATLAVEAARAANAKTIDLDDLPRVDTSRRGGPAFTAAKGAASRDRSAPAIVLRTTPAAADISQLPAAAPSAGGARELSATRNVLQRALSCRGARHRGPIAGCSDKKAREITAYARRWAGYKG